MICRLCNSSNLTLYYTQGNKNQFKLYKCGNCALVNLDLDGIDITQNQEKYEYDSELPDPLNPIFNKGNMGTYAFIKKKIKDKGIFLDIGCGNGALLFYAKQDGWLVKGLELSEKLAQEVKRKYDIEVTPINFMALDNFEEKYNLVALRHVLEHIPDSRLALSKLYNLLIPGGHAVLEFPNIEGISFKIKRFLAKTGLTQKKYKPGFVPGHCNEFSRKSFTWLATKMGFQIVKWETYSRNNLASVFYQLFPVGTKARVLIRKKE
ncbi:MAG: class I SAM-dependent methyltransferase [Bacteroidales bacterium]|nr:class I SAM-dependent methyltransferase [Bacteroidales bacterium]MCF8454959.1 class I SAM-dependent methyltransferase [Bacteroidales bacterium]